MTNLSASDLTKLTVLIDGHTQAGTTQRHAHLIESPLRAGVNAVREMPKPRLRVVGT
jgi:hypothetical protein